MTATREQRRRKREREKATRASKQAPTQRDVDRAIRERMRDDLIAAEHGLGSVAMLAPLWRKP